LVDIYFSTLFSELKNQNQQVSEPEGLVYMASDQSDVLMWKEKYQRMLENKS
jgi:hypothetical protein